MTFFIYFAKIILKMSENIFFFNCLLINFYNIWITLSNKMTKESLEQDD